MRSSKAVYGKLRSQRVKEEKEKKVEKEEKKWPVSYSMVITNYGAWIWQAAVHFILFLIG